MSQKAKNNNPESEDLFSSEELIAEKPFNEEEAGNEFNKEINEDIVEPIQEENDNEFMTEVETEAELLDGITEETEHDKEPTENDEEAMQTEISKLIYLDPIRSHWHYKFFRRRTYRRFNRRSEG